MRTYKQTNKRCCLHTFACGCVSVWFININIIKAHMLIFLYTLSTINKPHLAVHETHESRHDAPKKVLTDIRARHNADKRLQLLATSMKKIITIMSLQLIEELIYQNCTPSRNYAVQSHHMDLMVAKRRIFYFQFCCPLYFATHFPKVLNWNAWLLVFFHTVFIWYLFKMLRFIKI